MKFTNGSKLPEITLNDENGKPVSLQQFIGLHPLVIYFYPKNFTPGCTKEACSFKDHYQEFKDLGAEVIAISSDSESSHSKFKEKYQLPFIVLSDVDKVARKAFGVESNFFGIIPGRETFVFDKQGILQVRYNNLNAAEHTSKALKKIRELQPK